MSSSAFKSIEFSDWVRSARDSRDYVDTVEDFWDQHSELGCIIEERLKSFPAEKSRYIDIEKVKFMILRTYRFIHTDFNDNRYCPSQVPLVGPYLIAYIPAKRPHTILL